MTKNTVEPWSDERASAEAEALAADWRMVLNGEQVRLLRTEIYATWRKLHTEQQAELERLRAQLTDMTNAQHVNEKSLDEYARTIARLRGELAECEQWEDVPSGTHEINSDIDNGRVTEMNSISVDGNTLTVYEYFAGHSIQAHTTMPNNWRLQRRKESEEAGNDG